MSWTHSEGTAAPKKHRTRPQRAVEILYEPANSRAARDCTELGCRHRTHDGKPFCLEHIEKDPTAARILEDIRTGRML